jgi:hypothetical protein
VRARQAEKPVPRPAQTLPPARHGRRRRIGPRRDAISRRRSCACGSDSPPSPLRGL